MSSSASLGLGSLPWLCKLVSGRSLGQSRGTAVMPATICKTLGAFLTLTQACVEVVRIIATGAVLDLLLKRDRPPDTVIECSIQLKSME